MLAALWGCPVREAQARCDSREFAEWLAFYRIDPFGEQRADLRNGILAALVANAMRRSGQQPAKPEDFMPFREVRKRTPEEAALMLKAYAQELSKRKWRPR